MQTFQIFCLCYLLLLGLLGWRKSDISRILFYLLLIPIIGFGVWFWGFVMVMNGGPDREYYNKKFTVLMLLALVITCWIVKHRHTSDIYRILFVLLIMVPCIWILHGLCRGTW